MLASCPTSDASLGRSFDFHLPSPRRVLTRDLLGDEWKFEILPSPSPTEVVVTESVLRTAWDRQCKCSSIRRGICIEACLPSQ